MKKFAGLTLLIAFAIALLAAPSLTSVNAQDSEPEDREIHVRGTNPQTIGQYPHSFSYDGSDVRGQEWGFFELHLDSGSDTGLMYGRFHVDSYQVDADLLVEDAVITVIYPLFGMPTDTAPAYWQGGIAVDTLLHGDSGQEAPVLPTVFNETASWGPALVFIDGEHYTGDEEFMGVENVYGLMTGHMMLSEMVRDPESGEVWNADQSDYFSPMDPGNGSIFSDDISLLHLVAHTDTRDTEAFPPFTMFLHVNFYDIERDIDPIEVEYLTWEAYAEMDEETWGSLLDEWLALVDATEAELYAEESE